LSGFTIKRQNYLDVGKRNEMRSGSSKSRSRFVLLVGLVIFVLPLGIVGNASSASANYVSFESMNHAPVPNEDGSALSMSSSSTTLCAYYVTQLRPELVLGGYVVGVGRISHYRSRQCAGVTIRQCVEMNAGGGWSRTGCVGYTIRARSGDGYTYFHSDWSGYAPCHRGWRYRSTVRMIDSSVWYSGSERTFSC
jgi:hypothetical protein